MAEEIKILDTSNMLAGSDIGNASKAAILLNYKFFRFNGLVYDLNYNQILNLD